MMTLICPVCQILFGRSNETGLDGQDMQHILARGYTYNILVGTPKRKSHLEDVVVKGRIILK
jgi:hypothetical protein